jgi:murein DD-endopeptidase MepM/ murein hydrolase activator NlpD
MGRQRLASTRRRALLVLLLAVPLALGSLVSSPAASADSLSDARAQQHALQARIDAQRSALASLKKQESQIKGAISDTNDELTGINADQADLRAKIATATAALKAAEARYQALVDQLDQLDWTLGILQNELDARRADLQTRKRLLAARLAEAYRTQQTSLLQQVLTSESLTSVLNDVGNYLSVGDQDAQLASQIETDQAQVVELQQATDQSRFKTDQLAAQVQAEAAQLDAQRAALEVAKKKLDALEQRTQSLLAQQQTQLKKVYKTQQAAAAALAKQQAAERSLSNRIADLVRQQSNAWHIPSAYNGRLQWPMPGVVSQEFGCTGVPMEPAYGSCPHFHNAIDIVAPYGTAIHAAGSGTVAFVGYNPYDAPPQAWIVLIAHSSSLTTMYAHMIPQHLVHVGQHVSAGTVIGHEGVTGHTTGPHLHWAVELNGNFVNPRLFL